MQDGTIIIDGVTCKQVICSTCGSVITYPTGRRGRPPLYCQTVIPAGTCSLKAQKWAPASIRAGHHVAVDKVISPCREMKKLMSRVESYAVKLAECFPRDEQGNVTEEGRQSANRLRAALWRSGNLVSNTLGAMVPVPDGTCSRKKARA